MKPVYVRNSLLKVQLAHSCDFSHELASFFVLYVSKADYAFPK